MAQKSNFIVRGGFDGSSITKGLSKTQKQLASFQSGVTKAVKGIAIVLGSLAIGSYIKNSVKDAMTVESSINQLNRIMGDSANVFNNWAQTQAKAFGMARTEAYKYGATYSNLISTFSSGTKETEKLTTELLKASAITASATGRTMEDTMERIRSGLLGNTESIEDLGINVNVAMLESSKSFAKFANGKSWNQLDFKIQQQIRLMAILEQANEKYGDTLAGTTATKQMMFVATLQNVKLNIGQAFLSIYNVVLPALTALANGLEKITSTFNMFMQAVFGKGISTSVSSATSAIDKMANSTTAVGDAATASAKAVKKSLAGFDQITKLESPTSAGSDSGASSSSTSSDTSTGNEVESVNKFSKIAEMLKTVLGPASEALGRLKKAFEPFAEKIGGGLEWLWEHVLVPLGKFTIKKIIPKFFDLLSEALGVLNPILDSLKPLGKWLWEKFLQPIAEWTGGVIVTVLEGLTTALKGVGDWMSNNQDKVDAITKSLAIFFGVWKVAEILNFINISGGIVGALKAITTAIGAGIAAKLLDKATTIGIVAYNAAQYLVFMAKMIAVTVTETIKIIAKTAATIASAVATGLMTAATVAWSAVCVIATGVTAAFGAVIAFLTSPIGLVILAIGAVIAIGILLYKNWDVIKEVAINVFTAVKDFIGGVCSKIGDFFKGLWEGIKSVFSVVGTWFAGIFAGAWEAIKNAFAGVAKFFTGIWDKITGIFSTIGNVIGNAIGDAFKAVVNGIITFAEGMINGFLKAINLAIGVINAIPGVKIEKFNVIELPKLAKGGITNGSTIANIGENGREAIIPLENNTGGLQEIANLIADRMSGSKGSGITESSMYNVMSKVFKEYMNISLVMGDEEVARHANKGNKSIGRRTQLVMV